MSYVALPELIALLWMALVLARLRRPQSNSLVRLWILGLFLIVVEGVARMFYLMPMHQGMHALMHVIALDAYFLAGIAFFQSAAGPLRLLPHNRFYLTFSCLPHLVVLTLYGSMVLTRPLALAVGIGGLAIPLLAALALRRHLTHCLIQAVIWFSMLSAAWHGHVRLMAYVSLFFVYAAAGVAFFLNLPRARRGRIVVVTGFLLWSLCFLTHPWIAERRPEWAMMAEKIWDVQKFLVMFGLLIVSLEESNETNQYQALHDTLTGLPNRRLFEDRLDQAIARSRRNRSRVVLFNMDLNDFKIVNDTLGHDAGDELLREVGKRLHAVTRGTDTLARMGGDEFYLLINDFQIQNEEMPTSFARVHEQTDRLLDNYRQAVESTPYTLQGSNGPQVVHVRLSIGSAVFPDDADDRNELCRIADQKMYADKKTRPQAAVEIT